MAALDPTYTGLVNTVHVLYLLEICCLGWEIRSGRGILIYSAGQGLIYENWICQTGSFFRNHAHKKYVDFEGIDIIK